MSESFYALIAFLMFLVLVLGAGIWVLTRPQRIVATIKDENGQTYTVEVTDAQSDKR